MLDPTSAEGFDVLLLMIHVTGPMVEARLRGRRLDALEEADKTGGAFLDVGVTSQVARNWGV